MNSKDNKRGSLINFSPFAPQHLAAPRCGPARVLAIVLWVLVAFLFIPMASAQRLDDVWFKLRFVGKGRTLDDSGRVQKLTVSAPLYIHFASTGTHTYSAQIWTQTDSGWSNTATADVETIGANENFISDWGGSLQGGQGSSVHAYCTFYMNVKTDNTGAVKSGEFDGGGEIDDGMLALVNNGQVTAYSHYYGTCTIKGTVVKSSKLPFTP
jgi:hypothetical protein